MTLTMPRLTIVIAIAIASAGCGDHRPLGEPGGVPVTVVVDLEPGYVQGMSRPSARGYAPVSGFLEPDPWCQPYGSASRYRYYGRAYPERPFFRHDPFWDEPRFTDLYLLGGDGPAEAGVFRQPIGSGHDEFTVTIRSGHVVTLSVQARGDRDGWEAVGHFTAADRPGQRVVVTLSGEGPRVVVVDPPAAATSTTEAAPAMTPDGPTTAP